MEKIHDKFHKVKYLIKKYCKINGSKTQYSYEVPLYKSVTLKISHKNIFSILHYVCQNNIDSNTYDSRLEDRYELKKRYFKGLIIDMNSVDTDTYHKL